MDKDKVAYEVDMASAYGGLGWLPSPDTVEVLYSIETVWGAMVWQGMLGDVVVTWGEYQMVDIGSLYGKVRSKKGEVRREEGAGHVKD